MERISIKITTPVNMKKQLTKPIVNTKFSNLFKNAGVTLVITNRHTTSIAKAKKMLQRDLRPNLKEKGRTKAKI